MNVLYKSGINTFLAWRLIELLVERHLNRDASFVSDLWNSGAGISVWPCHPSLLLFMEPTEDCLCFVLRPSGCSAAQPWLIQVGLRGEQPGRVTPPGIWCLAAMKPVELRWAWSRGWNRQPLDTCPKNRTMRAINVKDATYFNFLLMLIPHLPNVKIFRRYFLYILALLSFLCWTRISSCSSL